VKFDYIVDYLCQTAGPSIDGTGSSDQSINKLSEAAMSMAFRRYICGMDGDEGCDFFKMDDDDQLYVFNGRHYEVVKDEMLTEIIVETMSRMHVGIVYQANSAERIKDFCMNKLKADERCHFDPDRRYICFRNGVFDCETGRLNQFDVKYKTDMVLDFDYVDGTRSALWDKVLAQTVPDESMRETFHQFCGCFLAKRSEYKIEYICFVVGEGQNGKSIICKAVINMLGRGVASSYSPEQLFKSGNQAEYHLADVNGKVVNYCDDVSKKDFSGGDFKAFVSGGEFTGRHPYSRRPTKVTKVPLMLCCANGMPPTTDDTDGYFRRFLIILAPNKIDERDKDVTLEKKLQADDVRAAIFNWMYEGYRSFVKNGGKIDVASSVRDIVEEMKENSNSLRRWISTMGYWAAPDPDDPGAPGWKSLKEWVQEYIRYCQDWGETPRSRSAVTEQFKKMGCVSKRRSDGIWYYMELAATEKGEKKDGEDSPEEFVPKSDPELPF
jgi:P4 family phage/plasmid primase-like protien